MPRDFFHRLLSRRHKRDRLYALSPRCGPRCPPPPGETPMIGSAGHPARMKKAVRHSRWPGPASSPQVSRSRAIPAGGRWPVLPVGARCRAPSCLDGYAPRREPSRRLGGSAPPRPCGPLWPTGGPAFQAVPALLRWRGYAARGPAGRSAGGNAPTGRTGRRSLPGRTSSPPAVPLPSTLTAGDGATPTLAQYRARRRAASTTWGAFGKTASSSSAA